MIKNSIHARKSMVRRAKTMKFEASKKRRARGRLPWLQGGIYVTVIKCGLGVSIVIISGSMLP